MTETEIQSDILAYLRHNNIWHRRLAVGGVRHAGIRKKSGLAGMPDIMTLLPGRSGRLVMIEVKTPVGKLSNEQRAVIEELEFEGVIVLVARAVEDVRKFFRSHLGQPPE